jgi:hypothetical protein
MLTTCRSLLFSVALSASLFINYLHGMEPGNLSKEEADKLLTQTLNNPLTSMADIITAVSAGADIERRDVLGDTALPAAVHVCSVETVRFLLGRGADVNARGYWGTPLASLISRYVIPGWVEVLRELLSHGAVLEPGHALMPYDALLNEAVMRAAQRGSREIVDILVREGATQGEEAQRILREQEAQLRAEGEEAQRRAGAEPEPRPEARQALTREGAEPIEIRMGRVEERVETIERLLRQLMQAHQASTVMGSSSSQM